MSSKNIKIGEVPPQDMPNNESSSDEVHTADDDGPSNGALTTKGTEDHIFTSDIKITTSKKQAQAR
jgi:hypothetical protein